MKIIDEEYLKLIPKRRQDANKSTYKKLLIIAGSEGMAGAAYLSALSAYKSACGMIKIYTPKENRTILQILLPEAMLSGFDIHDIDFRQLDELLEWSDLALIGPGLSRLGYVGTVLNYVLENYKKRLILDADALYFLADDRTLLDKLSPLHTLTPHLGEMSRLIKRDVDYIARNMPCLAGDFSKKYCTNIVLKSYNTIISDAKGELYGFNRANPALAKAGSGDVLSGIIAGLSCLGLEPAPAAATAVLLQSLAASSLLDRMGEHSILASEVAKELALVLRQN